MSVAGTYNVNIGDDLGGAQDVLTYSLPQARRG